MNYLIKHFYAPGFYLNGFSDKIKNPTSRSEKWGLCFMHGYLLIRG